MIRMAEEEEQEGKNPPSVLLVEAISADDKDDASMMQMMMTTNVCAYISYSYERVIDFAARAVQTWGPLDDDASMIEGRSKDDEVPMTERQKARGKACLVGGLISVVVIALVLTPFGFN